jgi:two-component system, NtrC family, nitrogen regulation sensor histidine kinase GlnL
VYFNPHVGLLVAIIVAMTPKRSAATITHSINEAYAGLELLSTAVMLLDVELTLCYANPAAETLFAFSRKNTEHYSVQQLLHGNDAFIATLRASLASATGFNEHELTVALTGSPLPLHVSCIITPLESTGLLLEFRPLNQQMKIAREERILEQQESNRQLIRNLAHEIRNPLGGIRGAAQLLEHELPRKELREYTQVIVKETDRLQTLMDNLLTPHRLPQIAPINIHEALERVRSVILAEYPKGISVVRDYDTSLPELSGDREQLIQAVLNIMRNAAQAMNGDGVITLRTRIARQVTLARKRYRHALQIEIIDNGPGVPENLRDTIFNPLVSGRNGGSGLGLSLAQTFINQHHGMIEFDSMPGHTCFSLLLPVTNEVS